MKKFLFLTEGLPPQASFYYHFGKRIIVELLKTGYEGTVISTNSISGDGKLLFPETEKYNQLTIFRPKEFLSASLYYIQKYGNTENYQAFIDEIEKKIFDFIQNNTFDLVFVFTPVLLTMITKVKCRNAKYIYYYEMSPIVSPKYIKNDLVRLVLEQEKANMDKFDKVIVNSAFSYNMCLSLHKNKNNCLLIPSFIDFQNIFSNISDFNENEFKNLFLKNNDEKTFLYIGQLTTRYQVNKFFEYANKIVEKDFTCKIIIYGEGDLLNNALSSIKYFKNFIFLGEAGDLLLARLIKICDYVVFPFEETEYFHWPFVLSVLLNKPVFTNKKNVAIQNMFQDQANLHVFEEITNYKNIMHIPVKITTHSGIMLPAGRVRNGSQIL